MDNLEQKIEEAVRLAAALKFVAIFMVIPPKSGEPWKATFMSLVDMLGGLGKQPEGSGQSLHAATDDLIRRLKARIADEMSKHESASRELRSVLNPRD